MKKIINLSNIISFVLVITLTILLITLLSINGKNDEQYSYYEYIENESDSNYFLSNKRAFEIEEKTITKYASYNAEVVCPSLDECYEILTIDGESDFKVNDILDIGTVLGFLNGEKITVERKSKVIKMLFDGHQTIFSLFFSNDFYVYSYVSQYDYYTKDFMSLSSQTFLVLSDLTQLKLEFVSLDYDYAVKNGFVRIMYHIIDPEIYLVPGVTGAVHIVDELAQDCYVVNKDIFGSECKIGYTQKVLYRVYDGKEYIYKYLELTVKDFYEQYAIVTYDLNFKVKTVYVII